MRQSSPKPSRSFCQSLTDFLGAFSQDPDKFRLLRVYFCTTVYLDYEFVRGRMVKVPMYTFKLIFRMKYTKPIPNKGVPLENQFTFQSSILSLRVASQRSTLSFKPHQTSRPINKSTLNETTNASKVTVMSSAIVIGTWRIPSIGWSVSPNLNHWAMPFTF